MGHPTGGEHDAGSVREVPAPSAVVGLEAVVASEARGTTLWLSALRDPLLVLGVIKLFPSGTSFKDTHPPPLFRSGNDQILMDLAWIFFFIPW